MLASVKLLAWVICVGTGLVDLVLPLPRSALNAAQLSAVAAQLAGPVAPVTASSANGMYWMSTAALLSTTSGPLDERAMSTQPSPGSGAMAAVACVLAWLSESRSAATPWPEPFGRAKLQLLPEVPSAGVMFSLIAPVTGLVAL